MPRRETREVSAAANSQWWVSEMCVAMCGRSALGEINWTCVYYLFCSLDEPSPACIFKLHVYIFTPNRTQSQARLVRTRSSSFVLSLNANEPRNVSSLSIEAIRVIYPSLLVHFLNENTLFFPVILSFFFILEGLILSAFSHACNWIITLFNLKVVKKAISPRAPSRRCTGAFDQILWSPSADGVCSAVMEW